jgi:hypothetical protein
MIQHTDTDTVINNQSTAMKTNGRIRALMRAKKNFLLLGNLRQADRRRSISSFLLLRSWWLHVCDFIQALLNYRLYHTLYSQQRSCLKYKTLIINLRRRLVGIVSTVLARRCAFLHVVVKS